MVLVTGAAGFIGFHVAQALLAKDIPVVGIDNLNAYYDPSLKRARLERLQRHSNFIFYQGDLCDYESLCEIMQTHKPKRICHLAAQAGVRYSLTNPFAYQKSNNEGFLNIIELARRHDVDHFVYASSSSVYGANGKLPFSETDRVDSPLSLYAATKRSNELTAHCYHHLFGLQCSGLRFFTVYGPWGRPDMALFIFTKSIVEGKPIDVYNGGNMMRNFTYIDDIVGGILCVLDRPDGNQLYNIGNDKAEKLTDFIAEIERNLGRGAKKNMLPMQPGDVPATLADIAKIAGLGFAPKTDIAEGIRRFIEWYKEYYQYA